MNRRILVVDENELCREQTADLLRRPDRTIEFASDAGGALENLVESCPSLVIASLELRGMRPVEFLAEIQDRDLPATVIFTANHPSIDSIVDAMRHGAFDILERPLDAARLEHAVALALEKSAARDRLQELRSELRRRYEFQNLLGRSRAMRAVFDRVARVASSRCTVLVTGETGTGKELVSHAIHHNDRTRTGPLVCVNCAAIPENLIESELFGHEKGSFTSADRRRIGRFEQAMGGTLLLDEIGSLPLPLQAKLLRVLQDGRFERVGGQETLATDARVIAATNDDLAAAVAEGRFREDLFYRLNVISIELPPLRDRLEDLPLLADHFLTRLEQRGFPKRRLSGDVLDALMRHDWPGNVRELEHVIEQMAISSFDEEMTLDALPIQIDPSREEQFHLRFDVERPLPEITEAVLERLERAYLLRVLRLYNGRIDPCAKHCGLSRRSISDKLRRYGIDKSEFKPHLAIRRGSLTTS
ncbi:MAG: sigma-54 dependent transcriptional regulator [Isosphaeraceae bacterium]|nr:sigma-54 dependent transcriptional regulator [Isosphaeraceae bacterium]